MWHMFAGGNLYINIFLRKTQKRMTSVFFKTFQRHVAIYICIRYWVCAIVDLSAEINDPLFCK